MQRLSDLCNYCLGNTINNSQPFIETLCPQYWIKRVNFYLIRQQDFLTLDLDSN